MTNALTLRSAAEQDVPTIIQFIQMLSEYERLRDACVATEDQVRETLFGKQRYAEVVLALWEDRPVGFALFFHNYSTFLARPGIYLEDLFVIPEMRGKGIGKALLKRVAQVAVERKCGRLEWSVLNWNTSAIDFYDRLGAEPLNDWIVYRLAGDTLRKVAAE